MKYYVVKVANGKEKKVKESIETELKVNPIENIISNILVPSSKTQQLRNGKKINVEKINIPGYIFIECESIDNAEGYIKHISGVQSVLKKPLRQSEVDRLLDKKTTEEVIVNENAYYIKERVKIIDGPFNTFKGVIKTLDNSKQKSKISVNVFDREVNLDLTYSQFIKDIEQ